uniref:hypothetical protein n=1 Tax=Altererythrobacter segetis TaxID=1104773 RepID=UPI0014075465|nr:hypothetical protein [Altererythrobacter segetis]
MAQMDTDTAQLNNVRANVIPNSAAEIDFVTKFAQCAGGERGGANLLRLLPASQQSDRSLFFMTDSHPNCAPHNDRLTFSVRNYRGVLAELLLESDFDLSTWSARGKPAKIFPAPTNDQLVRLSADSRSAVVMTEIGTCTTQASPAAVAALFATEAGTPAESTAIAAITPALAGCIPPGVEMKISKFQLRGYLAEGAYRYAVVKAAAAK